MNAEPSGTAKLADALDMSDLLQCELHGVGFHWSSKHCCALAPESAQKGFATGFMISRVSQCNASAGPLDILFCLHASIPLTDNAAQLTTTTLPAEQLSGFLYTVTHHECAGRWTASRSQGSTP
ncbi:hypothetical protein ABBQ38_007803 [Trebouxia sp. C0009 RCD-2024]